MELTNTTSIQATPASTAANPGARQSVISSDFETFLQMLTAQAKYQDPLEPLDSAEYASQLAQFSTVEQQVQTNDLLAEMVAQLGTSNLAQFASWVGMEGRSTAPTQFDGNPVTVYPRAEAGAQEMSLIIRDAQNKEVQRIALPVSTQEYEWTGKLDDGSYIADGAYTFTLEIRANGQATAITPVEAYSRIHEARVTAGQPVLILESGAAVLPGDISGLRQAS